MGIVFVFKLMVTFIDALISISSFSVYMSNQGRKGNGVYAAVVMLLVLNGILIWN